MPLNIYLKILAVLYGYGALIHAANLAGFGSIDPSAAPWYWRPFDVFYLLLDSATMVGLWRGRRWGVALFLIAAASQLVIYLGFPQLFALDDSARNTNLQLVGAHLLSIALYLLLRRRSAVA